MMIVLLGDPRSTNNIYRSTCRGRFATVYMSADGKALKESYQWQAKSQWKKKPLSCIVAMKVDLYFQTKREHDIDNYSKILLDSMTGIVYDDDKQIHKICIEKHYDKENPRIEVEIYIL